jgi:hypothetical protein
MSDEKMLLLIMSLIVIVTLLSLWASLNYGRHERADTPVQAVHPRPPPRVANKDADLIAALNQVKWR